MRFFSWNVNGVRAVARKGFLDWLAQAKPDVLGLQEIKATPDQLGPDLLAEHGYHVLWNPAERKGYSGTALFAREPFEVLATGLGEAQFDDEGRTTITRHQSAGGPVVLINCYFPHGKRDLSRVDYKNTFYARMMVVADALRAQGEHVVIGGDWNTAHQPIDLTNDKANKKTAGFTQPERDALDLWPQAGWIDAWRRLHPEEEKYTWWSNRPGVRERNIGWRIDYHWVAPELWPRVKGAVIHDQVLGSDHCPVELIVDEG
ncbi:MAG: exodeoxyribonuclease III [Myxococcales bacterium]|nr:exodeoxyribonuclease III [Myxococcales bacterium]MCB9521775.1 exodeoxyribonuclease III [Myxococcales bacterium]